MRKSGARVESDEMAMVMTTTSEGMGPVVITADCAPTTADMQREVDGKPRVHIRCVRRRMSGEARAPEEVRLEVSRKAVAAPRLRDASVDKPERKWEGAREEKRGRMIGHARNWARCVA